MRLSKISIKNYKGIDSLEFEFPKPKFDDESDIFVMCGENGVGKSSVLECSALMLMSSKLEKLNSAIFWDQLPDRQNQMVNRLYDLLVGDGSSFADISGILECEDNKSEVRLIIDEEGIFLNGKKERRDFEFNSMVSEMSLGFCLLICDILGYRREPIIDRNFIFFNSFRNHWYNSPEIHETKNIKHDKVEWKNMPVNLFKLLILNILMAEADILEFNLTNGKKNDSESKISLDSNALALESLNEIIMKYADGKIGKIWAQPDYTFDFRIQIDDKSFSFDSLGSGHKEIITMLFFIRYFSKDDSKVVIVDEPELHFNAQWHREFMDDATRNLYSTESKNQFIVATHSEDIFDSVNKRNRSMLIK